tara:strand:+ start:42 stop:611 length:570 start_codon:yes stop_codon:yes gene_type:complete
MNEERKLLVRIYRFLESDVENDFGLGSDIRELLTHPEPIKEREVSGKIISTDDACNWNLTVAALKDYDHVYVNGVRYVEYQPDINTQYLLDQVARLTAENAMLKEKWSEAQPEQEQEPVAWMDRTYGNLHEVNYGDSIPLYTSPPKREPLSDEEIADLWWNNYVGTADSVRNFARAIEKAHGITGVDDE